MIRQGSGVLLMFGGDGDPPRGWHLGGLQTAFSVIEAMRRQLSSELAPHGVRAVTLLGRAATLEDVGNVAAFVASDRARTMTAATVNVSAGALID
jgi:NAD(P)-dependent dehydrogenase (short-subunit alcohol dehydrogenase family)